MTAKKSTSVQRRSTRDAASDEWSRNRILGHCRVGVSVGSHGSSAMPGTSTTSVPTVDVLDRHLNKYFSYDFKLEGRLVAECAGDLD